MSKSDATAELLWEPQAGDAIVMVRGTDYSLVGDGGVIEHVLPADALEAVVVYLVDLGGPNHLWWTTRACFKRSPV